MIGVTPVPVFLLVALIVVLVVLLVLLAYEGWRWS